MSDWQHSAPNSTSHTHSLPVHRPSNRPLYIALLCVAAMTAIVCAVIWNDKPAAAEAAANAAPATTRPTATPGTPVRKPVEVSPPLAERIPGDGTWLVGAEIKAGTYKSAGGASCYWARYRDLANELNSIIVNSYGRKGPQKVALGPSDKAFASQGCGAWELIS